MPIINLGNLLLDHSLIYSTRSTLLKETYVIKGSLVSIWKILSSTLSPRTEGDFLGHFLLLRTLTLEDHHTLCYSPTESSRFYRSSFMKYLSKLSSSHFNWGATFYCTRLNPLTPDEAMMKEDLHYWFQRLDYEERPTISGGG